MTVKMKLTVRSNDTDFDLSSFTHDLQGLPISPSFAGSIALSVGHSLTDAVTNVLYLQETGDSSAISVHDINQGSIGDCYLLSSIGEIVLTQRPFISNMIKSLSNTTEAVTLYKDAKTGGNVTFATTSFKAVAVTVDNSKFLSYAVDGSTAYNTCTQNGQHEIWAQVLENAYAQLYGGYSGIANGGWPALAIMSLTGQKTQVTSPSSMSLSSLLNHVAVGDMMVFDTRTSNLSYGLVGGHAFMFDHYDTVSGNIYLDNPWGYGNPSPIPFDKLASAGIVEIDVGHTHG